MPCPPKYTNDAAQAEAYRETYRLSRQRAWEG